MKKHLLLIALVLGWTLPMLAQCPSAAGLTHTELTPPNHKDYGTVEISWNNTHSSYHVEWGPKGFYQGTGHIAAAPWMGDSNVTGNTVVLQLEKINNLCTEWDIVLRGVCATDSSAPEIIHVRLSRFDTVYHNSATGSGNLHFTVYNCLDSVTSVQNTDWMLGSPAHFNGIGSSFRPHQAHNETALTWTTPWFEILTNDAYFDFFHYSDSTGKIANISVSVYDGNTWSLAYQTDTFTGNLIWPYAPWHGNINRIDLSGYASQTSFVKLRFSIDQTNVTQTQQKRPGICNLSLNDGAGYVFDTVGVSTNQLALDVQSTPAQTAGTFYWVSAGPVGFDPTKPEKVILVHENQLMPFISTAMNIYLSPGSFSSYDEFYVMSINSFSHNNQIGGNGNFYGPLTKINANAFSVRGFFDANNNCNFDSGELHTTVNLIALPSGNQYVSTAFLSTQTFFTTTGFPANTTALIVDTSSLPNFVNAYTGCAEDTLHMNQIGSAPHNFPLELDNSAPNDLRILVSVTNEIRHNEFVKVWIENYSPVNANNVELIIKNQPEYSFNLPTNSNNDYVWTAPSSIPPTSRVIADLRITINMSIANLGDTLAFEAMAYAHYSEPDSSNNVATRDMIYIGSYDPNDKQAWPGGAITDTIDEVMYKIRFQNTGNAAALKVVLVDTLDSRIAPRLTMLDASHDYFLKVEDGVATWTFNNINLPDSASDPDGSIGHVVFMAKLKQPMVLGDSLANRAFIYFDYNAPIITNWAYTKIVQPEHVSVEELSLEREFLVYPNPANDLLNIRSNRYTGSVRLTDMTGKTLRNFHIEASTPTQIQVAGLAQGLYLLQTDNGHTVKVLIQRD